MLQKLLRIYSYLFAVAASVVYLALGMVSKVSGTHLELDSMPWKGDELSTWLIVLGVLGFISVLCAILGTKLRFLLTIFLIVVVYLTIKGNFTGAHSFADADDFKQTLWISAGALLAAFASLLQLKKKPSVESATK